MLKRTILKSMILFQWLYEGPKPVTVKSGSAQIAMVQEIYLPEHLSAARVKVFHEQRRVIDRISPNYQVAVVFHKDFEKPALRYFSDATGDYHRLTLDFQGYLEMLLEARATFRWQEFFVDDPPYPLSNEDAQAFRLSLTSIIPRRRHLEFQITERSVARGGRCHDASQ
ncbi:MAG: hypothetical protein NC238_05250 [Dehalobacter sp.]|nr:hypothetical protein [Dehalobacter sp.]